MYVTEVLTKTKKGEVSHRCILLRESYRESGKVKNRTIANLTQCDPRQVAAMRLALEHKDDLTVLRSLKDIELKEGMSIGAAWTIYDLARRIGIEKALGTKRAGKLALWQVMARVIDQGSRLSAVRLARVHAACDILGMKQGFNEDNLYDNLAWLAENQKHIERRLFRERWVGKKPGLFLYDVTSSYFEGIKNALAEYGYNRDKKSGKKQVVVGLLCDEAGDPVSVEVFTGSTRDFNTFGSQIKKAVDEFRCNRVTFVGDRGMIKSKQITELKDVEDVDFHYITAITKSQIEKLIKASVFQMELFDEEICEVEYDETRYVLRRNPSRAEEIARTRNEKKASVMKLCEKKNKYLLGHPRAKVETALREVNNKIERLKLRGWLKIEADYRTLKLKEDEEVLKEQSRLDGCYAIKTDLPKDVDKHIVRDRYRDLAKVEQAFRTSKTAMLEMRPWFVQTEKSTRGHALAVMLGYLITHYLQEAWSDLDMTVEEGLKQLSTLCSMQLAIKDEGSVHRIPTPRKASAELLEAANVHLPKVLPHLGARVVSRKKLQSRRKINRNTIS
jgi:hypothetical protein